MNTTTNETAYNVTELTAGVQYTFKVSAVAGDNITKGNAQEKALFTRYGLLPKCTFLACTEPEVIRNLTVSEITTSSVSLSWIETLGNRSFYRVEWTGGSRDMNTTTNETAFNVTELTAGVQYTFRVTAVAGDEMTEGKNISVSLFTKPEVIRNLTVSEITTSSVSLSWIEPLGNRSFYRVEWTNGSRDMNTTTNETAYNVTELTAGVQYTFKVSAVAGDNITKGNAQEKALFTKPEVIRNLTVSEITTSSVSLSWIEPLGNRSFYRVEWTNGSRDMNTTTNETAYNVTELTAGVQYTFKVSAVAGDNITKGNAQEKALFTKPEVIRNLTVSEITTSSVSLSWIEPLGNRSFYRVEWTDGSRDMNTTTNETAFNVTELTAGVKYTFKVSAVAGDNITKGNAQEKALFTKPEVIRNLTVSEITTSSVSLSWIETLGNRSFYRVEWTGGSRDMNTTTNETAFNVTELTAGVKYTFRVTAVAGDEMTEGKNISVSLFTKPEVIRNLTVSEITTSSVSLSWIEPLGNRSFYRVEWTDGSRDMNTTTNETAFNVTELTAGVKYTFKVSAVAGDNITKGNAQEKALFTKPEVIRNLTVSEITTSSVSLSWIEPLGNRSFYRVEWTGGSRDMNTTTNETAFNVTDLTAGVKYTFRVTAVAGDEMTEGKNISVSLFTKPEVIRNLTVSEITTSSVSLSWIEPLGNRSFYRVEWTDGSRDMNTTTNETAFNVTELTAGVKYTFKVSAVAGDNITKGNAQEKALFTKPEVIRNLTVSEITTSSVSLSWIEPLGNRSFYRVEWTGGSRDMNKTTNETAYNVTELTAGVKYTFKVSAVAGDNITKGNAQEKALFTKPAVIRNLTVSEITTSSVSLSWIEPLGNRSFYRVEWTDGSRDMNKTTNETAFNVTELTAGVKYTFKVSAVAGDNITKGNAQEKALFTNPEVIRNLTVSEITTSSVSLSWIEPLGNRSFYRVEWTGGNINGSQNTIGTSVNVTALTAGVQYLFTVTAVAGDNTTVGQNKTVSEYTKPEQPVDIVVTGRGTSQLNVTWTLRNGSVDYYKVDILNTTWNNMSSIITKTREASFTGLQPGRVYEVTVTAVAGAFNNTSARVQLATKPNPPGPLNITERTTSSLVVQWTTPGLMTGAQGISYNISYQLNGTGLVERNQSSSTADLSSNLTSLSSGTCYTITVKTIGPQNLESTSVYTSECTLPKPVVNLTATPLSNSSCRLQWTDPVEVKNYYTYRVQYIKATVLVPKTVSTNFTQVNDLEPGTGYNFTVTSVAATGSEGTPERTFCNTKPNVVSNLTVEGLNTTAIRLSWSKPNDHKPTYSYLVTISKSVVEIIPTTVEMYTFTNLDPGNCYNCSVVTVVQDVKSDSTEKIICTKPAVVANLIAIGTTTNMSVTWHKPMGQVDNYTVTIYKNNVMENSRPITNTSLSVVFQNLRPGKVYVVKVATNSGPLTEALNVTNATYPNPPGSIMVVDQTTGSINISWARPLDMDLGQYNFSVFHLDRQNLTEHNWILLKNLQSGTLYNISVVTVGPFDYQSTAVTTANSTRPQSVIRLIEAGITTTSVTLVWFQPESKPGYSFRVEVTNRSVTTNTTMKTIPGIQSGSNYNTNITGLQSGSNYTFTVTTLTGDGTMATPVTVSYFTRPFAVSGLVASTVNTTTVNLTWTKPPQYQSGYTYRIQTEGCVSAPTNLTTETGEGDLISELTPGTRCTFSVSVKALNSIEGESVSTSQYTKPESVNTFIDNNGSNSTIVVRWEAPRGNVEHYIVNLNKVLFSDWLNSSIRSTSFLNLSAGRKYTAVVTTISGPFNASSEPATTATYPNQPGPILVLEKTTSSISVEWGEAPLMANTTFSYLMTYLSTQLDNKMVPLTNTSRTLSNLSSGTPYNISVATVGVLEFQSEKVWSSLVMTRPESVQSLSVVTAEENITLTWIKPVDHKPSYHYYVIWTNSGLIISNTTTLMENLILDQLVPGSLYNFTVTTETADGTKGAPVSNSRCTNASPVSNLKCDSPNGPKVILSWTKPKGLKQGFQITAYETNQLPQYQVHYNTSGDCTPACGHTVSDLKHNTDYTLTVTTLGCGSSSTIQILTCKTGINAVIGVAVGVTIGVFAILFIITVGLIIHWRRQTKKDTSDIQIHSMRAKVSVAVRVEDFEAYYKRQKADSNCGFAEEFEDLKPVGTAQAKRSAEAPENKSKNRYNNVLPYESSRVKLSIHGSPFDDYINSNYIPGYNSRKEFIAAQGPLPVTVNEFWRMIWEKNVQTLVMLTRCNEQGRVKCEKYWPSETNHFQNITVTTTSEIALEDWTIRDFDVKNVRTAETRSVRHFHFTAWPDHGVPETTELLINFRHLVREHMDQYSRHSPTVVHCSAGVGRTGTFIAIDRLLFQIERDSMVDVYGTIHDLRMHRPLMVQTEDQYLFLNQCAIDIIRSRTGTNVDLIYQNTAALSIYENVEPRKDTDKNGYHNT
ncbi:receptor-type tyrosine-protein phosphatase eta-like [Salvelinus alpinus]|uniref:receptor-type tyrosine-protein phosphatase eta-like n=1 Tax=Salvelinus alpinus TaxID=8036 RepID=UPI0039FD48F8